MLGDSLFCGQDAGLDITARKVRDRIAGRLMKQHDVLTVGDVGVAELDPHPAAQRLRVQDPLRHRLRCEEVPDRCRGQWALLPCQSHRSCPSLGDALNRACYMTQYSGPCNPEMSRVVPHVGKHTASSYPPRG